LAADYPETSGRWLSPDEIEVVTRHLNRGAPTKSGKAWEWKQAIQVLLDPTYIFFTATWIFT
jgi:hypothetical protein